MKNRIEFIDISKGAGIILVVVGHCLNTTDFPGRWIYSFHMPFFFFISGSLLSGNTTSAFIYKKFKQLIVPFITLGLIVLTLKLIVIDKEINPVIYLSNMLKYLVTGNQAPFWFLPVLFCSSIAYFLISKIKNISTRFIILLGSVVLSYFFYSPNAGIPYSINSVFMAIFFVGLGYESKNLLVKINNINKSLPLFALSILLFVISISVAYFINPALNMSDNRVTPIIPVYLGAINGILLLTFTSLIIDKHFPNKISSILKFLGRNTLTIMCLHMFFISLSSEYIKYYIDSVMIYKFVEQLFVWSMSLLFVYLINKYIPVLIGKTRNNN